jgi:tRNA (mo5U34)-methyltransferase
MADQRVPTRQELERVFELPDVMWHQRWEVAPDVFTPGRNDIAALLDAAGVPRHLEGLRVLDVGAFNGCGAFEMERRGAAEVVALDIMTPTATGFSALAEVLGSDVVWTRGSAYELDPEVHGSFDLILFFGVLYHLRYPILALDRLRSVARGTLHVETHVIDRYWHDHRRWVRRLRRLELRYTSDPIWRQYRPYELNPVDPSNTFGPNEAAVVASLENSGFEVLSAVHWADRAAFAARAAARPYESELSYEAAYPPTAALGGIPRRDDPQFQD